MYRIGIAGDVVHLLLLVIDDGVLHLLVDMMLLWMGH
jgi:hypothetical protein